MNHYYTYILLCSDHSYYTGVTNDLDARINQHNEGLDSASYTYSRRPVKLMYSCQFTDIKQAIDYEKQIKGWSRKKKEALIDDNISALKYYAVCRNETNSINKKAEE